MKHELRLDERKYELLWSCKDKYSDLKVLSIMK